jgi:hypothetical protein
MPETRGEDSDFDPGTEKPRTRQHDHERGTID